MLTHKEIKERLCGLGRPDMFASTSIGGDDFFGKFVLNLKPDGVLEIGTYNGISTAVLASIANRVYTFDVADGDGEFIWNIFGVRHKISKNVLPAEHIKYKLDILLSKSGGNWKEYLNFNFAFIDGLHTYEGVKHDFEIVKFTGRVLFHDANLVEIRKFLDEIGASIINKRFAYWEKK